MALEIARICFLILGYFLIAISLIPLIRSDNWIFRIFEYPRAQKLVLNFALLIALAFLMDWQRTHDMVVAVLLLANGAYLSYQVYPYTILAKRQLKPRRAAPEGSTFKLLVCNVYQENTDAGRCLACIKKQDPDIVLLVETNEWWKTQLSSLEQTYHFHVLRPQENTYGMLLYSRLQLVDPRILELVEDGIPSIHTKVRLPSGNIIALYCLHPQPPVPQENPRSTERDAELLMVAKEAKASKLPVVVAGDLNDVAWSYTTELFMKTSGLLDPRRGRGFFNSFHARYWYLRWPLDHIFCSEHFQLGDLRRLPSVGSDHFPILVELALNPAEKHRNEEEQLQVSAEDEAIAERKIEKAG